MSSKNTLVGSKRKRNDHVKHSRNSKKQKVAVDLALFSQLPPEVFLYSIVPCIPLDFICVSKEYCAIALKYLHLDSRVKLDLSSFISVISNHNKSAFNMHITYGSLSESDILNGLDTAVKAKNYSVVKRLLKMDFLKNRATEEGENHIEHAAMGVSMLGDTKILKYVLRHIEKPDVPEAILLEAWYRDDMSTIKTVIKYGALSRDLDYSLIFKKLAEEGEIKYLQRMLEDPKVNLSDESILTTFGRMIFLDRRDVMELLAPYLKANPYASSYLEMVVRSDRPTALEMLLKLGIFDPMFNNARVLKETIITANSTKQLEMVKILLADSRMDLARVPDALIWANTSSYLQHGKDIFELLIQQPNINPLCRDPESDPMTLDAEGFFTIPIVQGLLLDYVPPPTPENQRDPTIIDVMLKGFMKVDLHQLFLVLNHPRVNFDYYAGYTIMRSLQSKKIYVAEAVLKDSRVKVIDKRHYNIAIECAEKHSLNEISAKIRALKKKKNLDSKLRPQESQN